MTGGQNNQYAEAIPLVQRSLAIREKALGPDHPNIVKTLNNLAGLYVKLGKREEAAALSARAKAMQERRRGRR
ncbi:MAG: tetratricopeptide repeat protein [Nitrospinota bacterium]